MYVQKRPDFQQVALQRIVKKTFNFFFNFAHSVIIKHNGETYTKHMSLLLWWEQILNM